MWSVIAAIVCNITRTPTNKQDRSSKNIIPTETRACSFLPCSMDEDNVQIWPPGKKLSIFGRCVLWLVWCRKKNSFLPLKSPLGNAPWHSPRQNQPQASHESALCNSHGQCMHTNSFLVFHHVFQLQPAGPVDPLIDVAAVHFSWTLSPAPVQKKTNKQNKMCGKKGFWAKLLLRQQNVHQTNFCEPAKSRIIALTLCMCPIDSSGSSDIFARLVFDRFSVFLIWEKKNTHRSFGPFSALELFVWSVLGQLTWDSLLRTMRSGNFGGGYCLEYNNIITRFCQHPNQKQSKRCDWQFATVPLEKKGAAWKGPLKFWFWVDGDYSSLIVGIVCVHAIQNYKSLLSWAVIVTVFQVLELDAEKRIRLFWHSVSSWGHLKAWCIANMWQ